MFFFSLEVAGNHLVVGGLKRDGPRRYNNYSEILDLTGNNSALTQPPPYPEDALSPVSALINGVAHVCGGLSNRCLVFDRPNDQWVDTASMGAQRQGAASVVMGDEWVILGGESGAECLNSSEIFKVNCWKNNYGRVVTIIVK